MNRKYLAVFFNPWICLLLLCVSPAFGVKTINPLRQYDIRDYGAVINDSFAAAANVTAFNLASDNATGDSRGVVYVPPGDWYVNDRLRAEDNVLYVGSGQATTRIISTVAATPVFEYFGNAQFSPINKNIIDVHFSNMTIGRNVTATAGGHGIILLASGTACGGACNLGLSDVKNVTIENQFDGIRTGPNNGGRWVSVTVQRSEHDGVFTTGTNGQYIDLSILNSKNRNLVLEPRSGQTIDGGAFSNCTFWAPGDDGSGGGTAFDGVPDNATVNNVEFNIPGGACTSLAQNCNVDADCPAPNRPCVAATNVSGFVMNGVTIDGSGLDGFHMTNVSEAAFSGVLIGGSVASANGVGIHMIRTKNGLTLFSAAGGKIAGGFAEGIKLNGAIGGTISGIAFVLSNPTIQTSIHVDNPSDAANEMGLVISGNFIVKVNAGNGILIEKTGPISGPGLASLVKALSLSQEMGRIMLLPIG